MANTRNAGRKPVISKEQLSEIIARRESGESVSALAQEYGVSRQALNKRIKEAGEDTELIYEYYYGDELATKIIADKKNQTIRLINYVTSVSRMAFGLNTNPSWGDFLEFLEDEYFKEKGVKTYYQRLLVDSINDPEQYINKFVPRFVFSKKERLYTRTDTDGFQLKAITCNRKYFVKSQAIISGVGLRDWAVEIIAANLCEQLGIPCVKQSHCEFVYCGRAFDGVYSENFELDGYTFISFENLLERNYMSTKDDDFITLSAIDKLKWCAKRLSEIGNLTYEDTQKYMIDLALVDCLVGNIDRHTRNFGLFYNVQSGSFEIPLVFDNGMGLFENDYYRDNYKSFDEAMNNVYVAPYGEDPFDMLCMLDEEFNLKDRYPNLLSIKYLDILQSEFAIEYERRILEYVRSQMD